MVKIVMGHPYGKTPSNIFTDFEWARENEQARLEKYGEQSLIIFQGQVIGNGPSYKAALRTAEANLTEETRTVTPIHVTLPLPRPTFATLRRTHDTD